MALPKGKNKQVVLCEKCGQEIQNILYMDMTKGKAKKKMIKRCGCTQEAQEEKK